MPKEIKDETWEVTKDDINEDKRKDINPMSLKNLKPMVKGTARAKMVSQAGAEATKKKFALQKELQAELKELGAVTQKMSDDMPEMDTYKFLQMVALKYLSEEDYEKAERVATTLLNYQKPKLSAVTQEIHEISTKDLTDEELEAKLRELEDSGHAQETQETPEDPEDL